jgi:hypothetical protein
MHTHEIGELGFDIYYHDGFTESGLCYEFKILKPDGQHEIVFESRDVPPHDIERVIARLYADGWQMIQLTQEFDLDDDGDPEIWFREAFFHRELK